jgi:hypothetical protein
MPSETISPLFIFVYELGIILEVMWAAGLSQGAASRLCICMRPARYKRERLKLWGEGRSARLGCQLGSGCGQKKSDMSGKVYARDLKRIGF